MNVFRGTRQELEELLVQNPDDKEGELLSETNVKKEQDFRWWRLKE